MAIDVVPELDKNIQASFRTIVMRDGRVKNVSKRIRDGTATLADAHEYAASIGEDLSEALVKNLTAETLPNGILYYNIAERTVVPALQNNYDLVNEAAAQIQKLEDARNNIGLKSVKADFPKERIQGLIDKMTSNGITFEQVLSWLGEPIVNNSEAFMDDFVDENAKFRESAGMKAKLIRKAEPKCCDWCAALEGEYDYGDAPDDIYRRHEFCRCVVTYKSERIRQNVWSKKTYNVEKEDIEARKEVGSDKKEMTREERIEQADRLYQDKLIAAKGVKYSRQDTAGELKKMTSSERIRLLKEYEAKRKKR